MWMGTLCMATTLQTGLCFPQEVSAHLSGSQRLPPLKMIQQNSFRDWGESSACKVFALQAGGLEFRAPGFREKPGMVALMCDSSTGGQRQVTLGGSLVSQYSRNGELQVE